MTGSRGEVVGPSHEARAVEIVLHASARALTPVAHFNTLALSHTHDLLICFRSHVYAYAHH